MQINNLCDHFNIFTKFFSHDFSILISKCVFRTGNQGDVLIILKISIHEQKHIYIYLLIYVDIYIYIYLFIYLFIYKNIFTICFIESN